MSCHRLPTRRTLLKAGSLAMALPALTGCLRKTSNATPPPTRPDALQRTTLLAAATSGGSLFVAGERGALYVSTDEGGTWTPRVSGTSVTLTALATQGEEVLAVGHAGTIVRSADTGTTWAVVLDGLQIGRLAQDEVSALLASNPPVVEQADKLKARAQRLITDGADKPLLDVAFSSERAATAVGAYGILMQTSDGGETWKSRIASVDNPKELHFNAIAVKGALQIIVGEQGICLRSEDEGKSYQRVSLPGAASLFSVAWSSKAEVWCGGLNGRLLRSANRGASYEPVDLGLSETITAIAPLADGRMVLGQVSGQLTVIEPQSLRHRSLSWSEVPLLSDLAVAGDQVLIGVGTRGPRRMPLTDLSL